MATTSEAVYAATAEAIGRRLVQDAYWHRGRCNWVGADPDDEKYFREGLYGVNYVALGPDLYGGTAGVALFLAALAARTGDEAVTRTARGAIAHALARVDPGAGALYAGAVGVAWAAARVGVELDDERLHARAGRLAHAAARTPDRVKEFDLISGRAGAITGLLSLASLLDDRRLVERARALGDELLAAARRSHAGWSWRSSVAYPRDLCGFSHGAAGAGWALLELYATTGEDRFREGGEAAFAYEAGWFDEAAGNWPDLRGRDAGRGRRVLSRSFPVHWCHGAAGIALSRLRAAAILGDPAREAEARTALLTTRAAVQRALRHGTDDFSLCHGLAGRADVLLLGSGLLRERSPWMDTSLDVGIAGLEMAGPNATGWPCGVPSGQTASLFVGLAGIGHFYLRLLDPELPSPLLIAP